MGSISNAYDDVQRLQETKKLKSNKEKKMSSGDSSSHAMMDGAKERQIMGYLCHGASR